MILNPDTGFYLINEFYQAFFNVKYRNAIGKTRFKLSKVMSEAIDYFTKNNSPG